MAISVNTSVDDLKSSVDCALKNNYLTVANLDDAIHAEMQGSNRTSVISFLKSRYKQLAGDQVTTVTLPAAGELALNTGDVLCKLPTDALHNQLHKLAETSRETRENLEATELAALILCALELERQKEVNHGLPWKEWVKSNCDFSHMTATKYARVLKAARIGAIKNLDPEIVPETAPSIMSQDELRDAGNSLANALQGLGGIRQLYLQLEIISLPGGKKPKPGDGAGDDPAPRVPSESSDIESLFVKPLRPLTRLFEQRKHLKLQPAQARELEGILKSYLDDLKLIR